MRIGVDVREFKKDAYTGLRTILRNFLAHVEKFGEHKFVFFGNQYTDLSSLPDFGKQIVLAEVNTFFWDQFQLPLSLRKEGIDVFFSPYIKTPLWRVCPYVSAVCDVIPLTVSKFRGIKALLAKANFFLYAFICSRRSVKVITLSKDARDKVSKIFDIDLSRLKVVYPSVEVPESFAGGGTKAADFMAKYDLGKPYLLYVGNFKPHKNLHNLIAAFDLLPEGVKNSYRLILLGGSAEREKGLRRVIAERGLSGKVIPVRNIDHEDVYTFIKNAAAFIFPSLSEGFGIPPVEAMALGVPVAASRLAPMTEVLGNAAIFFDPLNAEDISRSILKLLNEKDLREQCVSKGKERASLFNAKKMSQAMLNVIENAGKEKTLCISSEFPPVIGGISTHVYNLWSRLPREEIVVLTAKETNAGFYPDETLNVVRETYPLGGGIGSRIARTLLVVKHVWRQNCLLNIRRNHCAQVISAGLAGFIIKKLKGTPYVVYTYSADILEFSKNFLTRWIMKKVLAGSEHIIANSVFTKTLVNGYKLAAREKIIVSTPGVDTDRYNPGKGPSDIKERYGIPEGHKVILSVSRLAVRKGHDNVIKALPDILRSYPDVVYLVVGEGNRRAELETLVRKKGLERNVIFAGEMPPEELVFFYNACDIFIMVPCYMRGAGDVEGFGIVFLEANACGKPVIAGNSGGVPEAVIDGRTGLLVDPEDVGQIRDAVLRLLMDERYAGELGKNGLRRACNEFNWNSRAEELKKYV